MLTLLGPDVAEAVCTRVLDRLQRAESLPTVTLPVSKTEFPKLLCLDTMHWVALARAHYNIKNPTAEAIAALSAIRSAASHGRLVVPIFAPNLGEATEPRDEARRTRLAMFMVDLSGNFSVLNHVAVQDLEVAHAIEKHFVGTVTLPPIRPQLIRWGLIAAGIGRDVKTNVADKFEEVVVHQLTKEPEMSVASLVFAMDRATIERVRAREESGLEVIEDARKADGHLPIAERWSLAMFHYLREGRGRYPEVIAANLIARGIRPEAYVEVLADGERRAHFIGDLVQEYIGTMVIYDRDRSQDDQAQANDFKDGAFLGQAIAYGNVVMTERRWAHHANRTGVAKQFNTTVLASLKDLPGVLGKEGCF